MNLRKALESLRHLVGPHLTVTRQTVTSIEIVRIGWTLISLKPGWQVTSLRSRSNGCRKRSSYIKVISWKGLMSVRRQPLKNGSGCSGSICEKALYRRCAG